MEKYTRQQRVFHLDQCVTKTKQVTLEVPKTDLTDNSVQDLWWSKVSLLTAGKVGTIQSLPTQTIL